MYARSLAASLLSSAGAGSLAGDAEVAGVCSVIDAGAVIDENWLGRDVVARALAPEPAVVCCVGRSGCGGSAGIASVYISSSWDESEMIDAG